MLTKWLCVVLLSVLVGCVPDGETEGADRPDDSGDQDHSDSNPSDQDHSDSNPADQDHSDQDPSDSGPTDQDPGDQDPPDPCGNGVIDDGEACEAGLIETDCAALAFSGGTLGCNEQCQLDTSACVPPGCGNGFVDADEDCDDAESEAPGCNDNCELDIGYDCDGEPSSCAPICGDGVTLGTEDCDLGNKNGLADRCCTATCQRPADCEIEINDTAATANDYFTFQTDGAARGWLKYVPGDVDVWVVHLPNAPANDRGFTAYTRLGNPRLEVYDFLGNLLGFDDDSGPTQLSAQVVLKGLAPGDYFIHVSESPQDYFLPFPYYLYVTLQTCPPGFEGDAPNCTDIQECDHGACDFRTTCEENETPGLPPTCGMCPLYLSSHHDGSMPCDMENGCTPEFVAECENEGYVCINHYGQPSTCEVGNEFGQYEFCSFVLNTCDPAATCTPTEYYRDCGPCPDGMEGNGDLNLGGCVDVDECARHTDTCSALSHCTNLVAIPGNLLQYECGACQAGYTRVGSGIWSCHDIDECTPTFNNGSWLCQAPRSCENFAGGARCTDCPAGYVNNGMFDCTPL